MKPIELGIRHSKNRSLPASSQTLVNYYPEIIKQGGKSQIILHSTPGLIEFADIGTGPIHGCHVMAGVLYVVSGAELYKIDSSGTGTLLGTVAGGKRAIMSDSGSELCITNPSFGYSYTTSDGLQEITDTDYLPASTNTFIDGYFVFPRDNTGDWFISSLLDGTSFDSTDYSTSYGDPDDVQTIIGDHSDIFLFGDKSIEIKYNSGNADFPFSNKGKIERGCIAKYSVAKMDNTVYWLGDDWAVYRMDGYNPIQISDPALEYEIQQYSDVSDAVGWAQSTEGHKFYWLTFPTANKTWVFDVSSQMWHQRAYRDPLTNNDGRHRANCYTFAYNKHIVGDYENGKLYQLDLDTYDDNGDPLVSSVTFPSYHENGERFTIDEIYAEFEAGTGLTTGQGSDPQAMLEESRDGGRTYGDQVFVDMGKKGEYIKFARWRRRGSAYDYIIRLSVSDPVKRTLIRAYIR